MTLEDKKTRLTKEQKSEMLSEFYNKTSTAFVFLYSMKLTIFSFTLGLMMRAIFGESAEAVIAFSISFLMVFFYLIRMYSQSKIDYAVVLLGKELDKEQTF